MTDPLVSVLVPTYNGEHFLETTLRSALDQSHSELEVVVGDDGSTDGTPAVLARLEAEDPRLRVVRHDPNIGPLENPRDLLAQARGEYVKFLMHDDVLAPDCVRELVRGLQDHPQASLAFSHRVLIDEQDTPIQGHAFPRLAEGPGLLDGRELGDLVLMNCANVIGEPTTVLFRRADVTPEELWIVDGRTVDVLNDVQLWLLLLARGPAFYTPRTLSRFRQHPGQNTVNPRYVGRGERDWSRLADWGARNGFLADARHERRAHARALVEAAARVHQLIASDDYGAALEAAFLSTARLVELTRERAVSGDLAPRAHAPRSLERFTQELDVWTRTYPVALAAPGVDAAEVTATIASVRDVLAAGVARSAVLAVPPAHVERVAALAEAALAAGPDVDIDLVPTDDPGRLLPDPWLAIAPRGATWHHGRALAAWTFDVGAG